MIIPRSLAAIMLLASFLTFGSYPLEAPAATSSSPDLIVVVKPAGSGNTKNILHREKGSAIYFLSHGSKGYAGINLTADFLSARDPAISHDGTHILFSGQKQASSPWQVFSITIAGKNLQSITGDAGANAFSPLPVGTLFYLNDTSPVPQMVYVKQVHSSPLLYALFASNTDGNEARRISHNLFSDIEPAVLPNGRLVFSSFSYRPDSAHQISRLMAVSIDGTDLMPVSGDQEPALNHRMASVGFDDRLYAIESPDEDELAGGDIISFSQLSPLHSRKKLTASGRYAFPCPLPDGTLLASKKGEDGLFNLVRLDGDSNDETLYSQPGMHVLDAQPVTMRYRVRGRSSVVGFRFTDSGVFFCMDVYQSDRPEIRALKKGSVASVLITEAVLNHNTQAKASDPSSIYSGKRFPYSQRIIGRVPVEPDGSFQVRVPSETPLTFHLLDAKGQILASQQTWTWVMHGESRGCIGCHEDRELSPPNIFIDAVKKPPVELLTEPDQRQPFLRGEAL